MPPIGLLVCAVDSSSVYQTGTVWAPRFVGGRLYTPSISSRVLVVRQSQGISMSRTNVSLSSKIRPRSRATELPVTTWGPRNPNEPSRLTSRGNVGEENTPPPVGLWMESLGQIRYSDALIEAD